MSFSSKVKNEIAKLQDENSCCQIAELSALIKMNGTIQILGRNRIGIKLTTENAAIARNIFSLIKNNFDFNTKVAMTKNKQLKKNYSYTLLVDSDSASENILKKLFIINETAKGNRINNRIPNSIVKKDCCKRAYLRGVFLGGGSISDPEKTYHLEMVTSNETYAKDIKNLINSFGLNAKIVLRKDYFVVYLKEGENIVDFLNIIGAHSALLDLENVRIYKEMRNNVNRLVNCETANLSKTVNAAMRQINNIKYIKEHMGLNKLPKNLRDIAEARLLHQDASLKELGEMLSPAVGKSGVNHRLRKLDELAEQLKERNQ
ncbi:DNA-binding protein WhiA [Lutispora sp.]|jgi:DNA-binding protein WhiA|uniref:DNA-binding protein WhiA n=1 Tax=Lutispora sp. TaxID=2828727 RepID=UPI0035621448